MHLEYSNVRTSTASLFIKLDTKNYSIWFSNKVPLIFYRKSADKYIVSEEGHQIEMRRIRSVVGNIPQEKIHWVGIQTLMKKVREI